MAVSGGVDPMEIDQMMEVDLEVHHREAGEPVAALATMADALPGLGIVAAVLGIVITMGSLGGPKEEIGEQVAAALVGTFLGILLCYGVFGPLAAAMGKQNDGGSQLFRLPAHGGVGVRQRDEPDHGGGTGAPLHSRRTCARRSRRWKAPAAAAARWQQGGISHAAEEEAPPNQPRPARLSSSRRRSPATAGITAAPGKWLTPISSPP